MAHKIPTVAIVGRTNVGKSTLFNAIIGRRISLVEDQSGVTRDRLYHLCTKYERPFTIIDTGGIAGEQDKHLSEAVRSQTELAIQEADLVVGVLDGIAGVHPFDKDVVSILRKAEKKVLWVINKSESAKTKDEAGDFYALGIEDPIFVAAAHKTGVKEMVKKILETLGEPEGSGEVTKGELPIRIAFVGRPNVGKSSLVNKILGEERVIASPVAGTTRDSVDIELIRDGVKFRIADTAGLRKRARVADMTVERFSNLRTLKALVQADVAVVVLDATEGMPNEQDAKIAGLVHERGRGLMLVVNKWDAIAKDHRTAKNYEATLQEVFKFAPYAPILFVSAKTGQRCPHILKKAQEIYVEARTRVKTAELNRVLERVFAKRPPPVYRGEPVRLFFATQTEVAPPTFVLFLNHPQKLGYSYERHIKNAIRKEFPFEGSDIKIFCRKKTEKEYRKGKDNE